MAGVFCFVCDDEENGCETTDDVREKAFKVVFDLSCDGEITGYISDDFGMIADSKMLNRSYIVIASLLLEHRN